MNAVRARARCRVDFAGGTLDLWPLGVLHDGALTVNLAIEVGVGIRLEPSPRGWEFRHEDFHQVFENLEEALRDPATALLAHVLRFERIPPCRIDWWSESPRGAGLGASSAIAIAALAACELARAGRLQRTPLERARVGRDLEARLMGLPTGMQDHLASNLGGLLAVHHEPGGERVEALDGDFDTLSRCLLVAYSGESHLSGATNWQVVRSRLDGLEGVRDRFERISAAARQAREAVLAGDWKALGAAVAADWSARRELAPGVSLPRLERLLAIARDLGAWGGKACGAGGGGCVLSIAPPERIPAIAKAWREEGAYRLEQARPSRAGLEVEAGEARLDPEGAAR